MINSIGKLLWHKAIRESAYFPPLGGVGEVIIKVPVIFEHRHPCGQVQYEDIKLRIILAVCNCLFKYNKDIRQKAETSFTSVEATVIFNNPTSADALVTFKTPHLDVWQAVCNNKFNNKL